MALGRACPKRIDRLALPPLAGADSATTATVHAPSGPTAENANQPSSRRLLRYRGTMQLAGGVGSRPIGRLSPKFPVLQGITGNFRFFATLWQGLSDRKPPDFCRYRGLGAANSLDAEQGISICGTGNLISRNRELVNAKQGSIVDPTCSRARTTRSAPKAPCERQGRFEPLFDGLNIDSHRNVLMASQLEDGCQDRAAMEGQCNEVSATRAGATIDPGAGGVIADARPTHHCLRCSPAGAKFRSQCRSY